MIVSTHRHLVDRADQLSTPPAGRSPPAGRRGTSRPARRRGRSRPRAGARARRGRGIAVSRGRARAAELGRSPWPGSRCDRHQQWVPRRFGLMTSAKSSNRAAVTGSREAQRASSGPLLGVHQRAGGVERLSGLEERLSGRVEDDAASRRSSSGLACARAAGRGSRSVGTTSPTGRDLPRDPESCPAAFTSSLHSASKVCDERGGAGRPPRFSVPGGDVARPPGPRPCSSEPVSPVGLASARRSCRSRAAQGSAIASHRRSGVVLMYTSNTAVPAGDGSGALGPRDSLDCGHRPPPPVGRLSPLSVAAQGSAYLLTHRSWTSRIGTGLRKWSFSRPAPRA